ncbi:MAG: hypothetical protein A4E23_00148 [Methanomethylovorans sp. PtaU1.Bin073]|nr:MAG: hypothetical protein A4E23_00148 [Methanomethylovorans sp. PtaU1.Bin073]
MNSLPGFSPLETFLIAIILPIFASRYIGSYNDFRKELIEARRHFKLYSNVYSNFYSKDKVSDEDIRETIEVQKSLRIIWANMESKFFIIPPKFRELLIYIRWLPKPEELEKILGDMLSISNSPLIYESQEIKRQEGGTDASERLEHKKNILEFINKYIK